jgi:hypothetical protein
MKVLNFHSIEDVNPAAAERTSTISLKQRFYSSRLLIALAIGSQTFGNMLHRRIEILSHQKFQPGIWQNKLELIV